MTVDLRTMAHGSTAASRRVGGDASAKLAAMKQAMSSSSRRKIRPILPITV